MKVAAIYWPTSSVGGINTELRAFHDEATRRKDTFHVLRSGLIKKQPCEYGYRKLIRGGDTFITIDGEASHHPNVVANTVEYLNKNYDRLYLAFLCPHPTKDYGTEPHFLKMLEGFKKPITARVTDGYWETYAEWATLTAKMVGHVTVSQPAFAKPLLELSDGASRRIHSSWFPFSAREPKVIDLYGKKLKPERAKKPLTVWTSQWKAIKGIHKLLPYFPQIKTDVELYSNGILYYQLRTTPEWKAAVGTDHFGGTTPSGAFSGDGRAPFYGYIPLEDIPTVLSRAWFMIDLMGIGKPKNKVYTEGSFNNTTVEALYYGACPILHEQASKVVPRDIALFVNEASEVPALTNDKIKQAFATSPKRQEAARKWVAQNFAAKKVYDTAILGK